MVVGSNFFSGGGRGGAAKHFEVSLVLWYNPGQLQNRLEAQIVLLNIKEKLLIPGRSILHYMYPRC